MSSVFNHDNDASSSSLNTYMYNHSSIIIMANYSSSTAKLLVFPFLVLGCFVYVTSFTNPQLSNPKIKLLVQTIPDKEQKLTFPYLQTNSCRTSMFSRNMNHTEYESLKKVFDIFDRICSMNQIDYFLYGGSLLGSVRHHDIIPWDDDVDVMVPYRQARQLRQELQKLRPWYILKETISWKFYSNHASRILSKSWKWPFLDIFFYDENETHIWDMQPNYIRDFVYYKTDIFPFKKRPFLGRLAPSPAAPVSVLGKNYDVNLCLPLSYNHRTEGRSLGVRGECAVPCHLLQDIHPFVKRVSIISGGCNETLNFRDKVLNVFIDNSVSECE